MFNAILFATHAGGGPASIRGRTRRCDMYHLRSAFSLVELLVVVGVVVVLVGLLLPAISGTKAEAKRRICQAEMRHLAMMITAYCGDNADRFPFPLRRRGDGNYESAEGAVYTPVRAVSMAGYWPVAMFDDFGRSMYADALLCPADQFSIARRAHTARALGIPEAEVQGHVQRMLSTALLLDPRALSDDMTIWRDHFFRVNALHDAQFPSQKAMLVEHEPLHEPGYYHLIDETGEYIGTLPDRGRYHAMIAAVDGSADWRLTTDCIPGIEADGFARAFLADSGLSEADIELSIQHSQRPEYFNWTRDGVRGRDW